MSTEHQHYSTANQSIAILQYAQEHNMEVVRTYADHRKSGLGLSTRSGLKRLLADAVEPDPGFQAVLVYDVSRWGRFQNPDRGASYEYALEIAHIKIHYCAEQFQNDGTLSHVPARSRCLDLAASRDATDQHVAVFSPSPGCDNDALEKIGWRFYLDR